MKRWLLVVWLGLVAGSAEAGKKKETPAPVAPVAEEPRAPIVLPCSWEPGFTVRYTYVRRRTDARQPVLAQVESRTPVSVEVLDGGNPARFSSATGPSEFIGPDEATSVVRAMLGDTLLPPMRLVMTDGTLSAVENQAELVAAMEGFLRAATAGASPEVIDQTLALLRDPVSGTAMLLKEPGKLFAMHCVALAEGQAIGVPMEYPNPFGGPPIAGHSSIRVEGYDVAAGTLTIATEDTTDPEALRAMLPGLIEKFVPPGTPMPEGGMEALVAALPPIETRLVGRYVMSVRDGFPVSVDVTQTIGAAAHPMARSDRWTWTRAE